MDGVVVLDVRRLDIGADVVHPTLAALFHFLDDDTLQVSVCQRFPLFEAQVVGTEFRYLLHHVVAQLIATAQEIFNAAHDTLLLVHLRNGLSVVRFFIGISEDLPDEVFTKRFEAGTPRGSHRAALLWETLMIAMC